MPHWYLVQCKPREDVRALEHLTRQGFHCYRPTCTVERRRQGRWQRLAESLFPGYLFIHLDSVADNWQPIASTRGVQTIVRFGQQPARVSDAIVAAIQKRLEGGAAAVKSPFVPGERVRILEGPFADLEAIFVAIDGQERVSLMLQMLQKEHVLSFPLRSVATAM